RALRDRRQQLPTVHHRHPQVEKDCIRAFSLLEPCQRLAAVTGRDHGVAALAEHVLQRLADLIIIVDNHEQRVRLPRDKAPVLGSVDHVAQPTRADLVLGSIWKTGANCPGRAKLPRGGSRRGGLRALPALGLDARRLSPQLWRSASDLPVRSAENSNAARPRATESRWHALCSCAQRV